MRLLGACTAPVRYHAFGQLFRPPVFEGDLVSKQKIAIFVEADLVQRYDTLAFAAGTFRSTLMRHALMAIPSLRQASDVVHYTVSGSSSMSTPTFIDIGVNLTHRSFARDRDEVIDAACAAGVTAMVLTGTSLLVARAIALSRYVPFDAATKSFAERSDSPFHALNLSALSSTLIESELFGHKRGAFTGAVGDRKGWLETCPAAGSVFLDEIGEVEASVQVKLLRVLEDRKFCRVGETRERSFRGKIIAATNRDLAAEMLAGRFRTDLYYRLCADTVRTPSLRERLVDSPAELGHLVIFLAKRCVGDEAATLAVEVESWILHNLGDDYAWPGNVRELEQCVRNVLIRREYHPPHATTASSSDDPWLQLTEQMRAHELSADDVIRRYCKLVYGGVGSFERAAAVLKLDRRTVRAKI